MKLVMLIRATILLCTFYLCSLSFPASAESQISVGAEQIDQYLPRLKGKKLR